MQRLRAEAISPFHQYFGLLLTVPRGGAGSLARSTQSLCERVIAHIPVVIIPLLKEVLERLVEYFLVHFPSVVSSPPFYLSVSARGT